MSKLSLFVFCLSSLSSLTSLSLTLTHLTFNRYQYRWLYSAAFLSHQNVALVLLFFIAFILFYFAYFIIDMTSQNETIRPRSRSLISSLPGIEMTSTPSPLPSSTSLTAFTSTNSPADNDLSNNPSHNHNPNDPLTTIELHEDRVFSSSSSYHYDNK